MLAIAALAANSVFATDITWIGAADNYWTNAANWSPPQVPTATDQEKVKLMAQNRPQANDLKAFLQQGGLKEK